jgi:SPX domain protein involved in polyphosphate accumulation
MNSDYRYEIKFVLDNVKLSEAMKWIFNNTSAYRTYQNRIVNSIYFDDVGFSSARDNLTGIANRNKFRLRWYGSKKNGVPIYEVKTKNGRLGSKKTYPINSANINLLDESIDRISSECTKALERHNIIFDDYLLPTLQVSYEREYYQTYEGIRITIDHKIKFSDTQLHSKLHENNWLSYPSKVMEIKFEPNLKDLASNLIKPLHLMPKRHSKYLVGLAVLGYAVYV